ncbi:class I SAM-dependent methyltransferase [[Eubacterium] cellulosolvens]
MGLRERVEKRKTEKMSDSVYRMMNLTFKIVDFLYPYVKKRVKKFGIKEGMTIVDYGCGPGRYTTKFAELVGEKGKVYALDIHELAIEDVKKKVEKDNLRNIEPLLVDGYNSTLPNNIADIVCAIDMFWIIKKPTDFLAELSRITKNDGVLVVDDGHQPRSITKKKILDSELWNIVEETKDHLKCKRAQFRNEARAV